MAKYRPFGLEKHHNEKFLAQLLNTGISYMTSDEGQMLLRRLRGSSSGKRLEGEEAFSCAHSQAMQCCR